MTIFTHEVISAYSSNGTETHIVHGGRTKCNMGNDLNTGISMGGEMKHKTWKTFQFSSQHFVLVSLWKTNFAHCLGSPTFNESEFAVRLICLK